MDICCFNISNAKEIDYEHFKNIVSIERKRKAESYRLYFDSVRSIYSEILLKYILKQKVRDHICPSIDYNIFGKPYLRDKKDFFFNISHSGDWVIIAYDSSEVGVDIEKINTNKSSYLRDAFTKEEQIFIYTGTGEQQIKKLFLLWTLKESYVKYLGTGMNIDLTSFSFDLFSDKVRNTNDGKIVKGIYFKSIILDNKYYLSVCGTDRKIYIKKVENEELINILL